MILKSGQKLDLDLSAIPDKDFEDYSNIYDFKIDNQYIYD